MLLDIDNFKRINDTYGHKIGDLLLNKFSKIVFESITLKDKVYRIGGDEFAVIGLNNSQNHVKQLAKTISKQINESAIVTKYRSGVSMGACITNKHIAPKTLFTTADKALFKVKKNGKAGVEIKVLE